MKNRSVPRAEWYRFFDDFSRRHREELVDVTVFGNQLGAQHEARQLPLNGIVADRFGKELSIVLGGAEGANVDHPVDRPVRVWVEEDERGDEVAVAIESENEVRTILELSAGSAARRRR
jgi:Family of unknown function (DUF5335)